MCVGGKTYIQIDVYDHHQTSPLPPAPFSVSDGYDPPRWELAAKGCGHPSSLRSCGAVGSFVGWK